ncbi:egg cell-secreted protein 1.2-like [Phoenix dactylifera]|uniref:Egg cell-secreted protein 1.2-like n=1 Tax=Phoenix dactylifera TaxID=42345 RepID=A0A8B8ZJZ1_PHODC|nr:egg cell-secreted protein 1.2-like [Phoenix dactylifera]
MSPVQKLALSFMIACLVGLANARELSSVEPAISPLEARITSNGGLVDCWNALLELKSCTDEILLFFMNGESYLGVDCCRAIQVITRQCWTTMLQSLGFTPQESDVLRGYCDAEAAPPPVAVASLRPHSTTSPSVADAALAFAGPEAA